MPYTSLSTVASGDTIDPAWGNLVDTNLDWLANPPSCRVYHNTNQSIANATDTMVQFNTEQYDTGGMFTTATNTRITIPVAGIYEVTACVRFAAHATGFRYVAIMVNGLGGTIWNNSQNPVNSGTLPTTICVSDRIKLVANDFLVVDVYQTSGGALTVEGFGFTPSFSARWVGTG